MSFGARREYFKQIWRRYNSANRKQKKIILDEFCEVCGYSRKYAIRLLSLGIQQRKKKSGPKAIYDGVFVEVLFDLWLLMQRMCGKKMVAAMNDWLRFYTHAKLTAGVEEKLKKISASHIDRLLAPFKKLKGRSTTKRGHFIKTNIPIQTRHDGAKQPGFIQGDTVGHCGSNIEGRYAHTLTITDIFSNWTENRSCWGKEDHTILEAYLSIEKTLPFVVVGWSSDNGSEFLNETMFKHLTAMKIKITRGRPSHKNDNPHVEQKNNTHVRKLLGYHRLDYLGLVKRMNEIYENYWNLLQNFFTPSQKLIKKERVGAKIVKRYDKPQTPYHRLMQSNHISEDKKAELKRKYDSLNPVYLAKQLEQKKKEFFKFLTQKRRGEIE